MRNAVHCNGILHIYTSSVKLHTYFISVPIIYTPTWSGGFSEMLSELPVCLSVQSITSMPSSGQFSSLLAMAKNHKFIHSFTHCLEKP